MATYWLNVVEWCGIGELEYGFAKSLLPLPIDQRYDKENMIFFVKLI